MKALIPPLTALVLLLAANGEKLAAIPAAILLTLCLFKR